jgi:Predicted nucleotide-binding protein containing TIR-like domain
LPKDRTDIGLALLKENGHYAGLIRDIPTGLFVALSGNTQSLRGNSNLDQSEPEQLRDQSDSMTRQFEVIQGGEHKNIEVATVRRVFITHGKNHKILEQIKEIVRYGKHEPLVSVERETVSKPVPDKVLEDMRSCQAAVIHVAPEGVISGDRRKVGSADQWQRSDRDWCCDGTIWKKVYLAGRARSDASVQSAGPLRVSLFRR